MKKINSKKLRIIWCSIITSGLLIPTVAVSAIACSPEIKPIDKNKIILNTKPVNGMLFLNQDENLPVLSVEAKVDNQNAKLVYQWYESDSNSTTNGKAIPGATQSTYTIPKSYTQKAGTRYFYAIISTIVENNIVNSVISSISTVEISDQLPPIKIKSQPTLSQNIIIKQSENLPVLSADATTNNSEEKLTYQWYSNTTNSNTNGQIIVGATSNSYAITENDVNKIGSKYYYVKISGSINGVNLKSINSNTARINVNLPEIIINKQPLDKTTTPWTHILPTFSVAAESLKGVTLNYQWYSNATNSNTGGVPIQGATNSSYRVQPSDVSISGATKHYYVQISGTFRGFSLKTINSNPVNLNVDPLPIINIQTQPINQTAILGTANLPTFSVAVNNIEGVQFRYQWYWSTPNPKDSWHLIDGATSSSYRVQPSDVSISGATKHYYVRVNGSINGVPLVGINSSVATLTVNPLPVINIQTQPVNKTVILGTANLPTFSVAVNNIEGVQFRYQWYSNTSNSTQGATKIPNATNLTYTTTQFDVGNVGLKYFFVQISGSIDGVELVPINSNVVNLSINAFPTITISSVPQNLDVAVNKLTNLPTFSVTVNNIEGAELKYQWYENDNSSTSGGTAIVGANQSFYTINANDVKRPGKKYYYVKISGVFNGRQLTPVVSKLSSLTISNLPIISINKQPINQSAILGTANLPTFSVAVNPIQDAQLNYQWFWGTPDPKDPWHQINGATSSSYQVTKSDVSISGATKHYYVRVNGSINGVPLVGINSSVATLTVNPLPVINIQTQPQNQVAIVGQTENLPTFSVAVNPIQDAQLNYQWFWSNPKGPWNKIDGATNSSYQVTKSDVLIPRGTKRYYVKIGGNIQGVKLQSVNSSIVTLWNNSLSKISIRTQPQKNNTYYLNTPGQTAPTFSVAVNPIQDAKFTYQWYMSTEVSNEVKIINGATNPTYIVPASDLKTPGKKNYMVTISASINGVKLQSITSNTANLTISAFPKITINKQPTDKTVDAWESKLPTFSVAVNPIQDAQLNYQWFWGTPDPKDPWHQIDGATASSYTVNPYDVSIPEITKHYYVSISGFVNGIPLVSINSNVATLKVNYSPKVTIISNPKSRKVYTNISNSPVVFSVVAKTNVPNATLKYQWYKKWWNGFSVSEGAISGATDVSYTVPTSELYNYTFFDRSILYYVKVTATLNGKEIASTISGQATLSFGTK